MFGLEKWADAFDKMHAQVQRDLDGLVGDLGQRSGATFGADSGWNTFFAIPVGIAYALGTFTLASGKGLVDVLRLGEGVKSGSASGVGQDALRLLNLIPAAGAVAKGAGVGGRALIVASAARSASGGPMSCGIVSSRVALQVSGTRAIITAEEVANLANKTLPNASTFPGMWYSEMKTLLQGVSTATQELNVTGKGIGAIEGIAAQGRGPVVFGVHWWGKVNGVTQPLRNGRVANAADAADHWMVAFRSARGQVMVADQFGVRAIGQAGTTGSTTSQFTVTSRALLVGDGTLVRGLGTLERAGQAMTGASSATATNWLASSLAVNMVLVNAPTMAVLDAEQRKRTNMPPRDWTRPSGDAAGPKGGGAMPPTTSVPKPNPFSSTVLADSQFVLSKLPTNRTSREVAQLRIETGLSDSRVQNAVLQLKSSGLVRVTKWSTGDRGQHIPAIVERALRR